MSFDLEKLNDLQKNFRINTFAGIQICSGLISKKIQDVSYDYEVKRQNAQSYFNSSDEIASHVFAIAKEDEGWMVYESHANSMPSNAYPPSGVNGINNGVRKLKLEDFNEGLISAKKDITLQVFPFDLSVAKLNYYVRHNPGYALTTIAAIDLEAQSLGCIKLNKDTTPALICSEYLAECDSNCKLNAYFELACWQIIPVHYQIYAMRQGLNIETVATYNKYVNVNVQSKYD